MNTPGLLLSFLALTGFAQQLDTPLFRLVDVNQGEPTDVALPNGTTARVQLLERSEIADTVRGAVRLPRVRCGKVSNRTARSERCAKCADEFLERQIHGHSRFPGRRDGRRVGGGTDRTSRMPAVGVRCDASPRTTSFVCEVRHVAWSS